MSSDEAGVDEAHPRARLDNLTLARKEGWQRLVEASPRIQPPDRTKAQLKALSPEDLAVYNRDRRNWHANLGPFRTPQLEELHEDLWDIVDSNAQDGDKAKGAIAVDAFPGLGKTTAVLAFAKQFHQREVAEKGQFTEDGHERWPVCRVGLTGNTGMKDFNRAMLEFFGHPGAERGTTAQFAHRALDCVISCDVKLLVVDDLHFLAWKSKSRVEISNHFKYIANEFPVTMLFAGFDLAKKGLFSEGDSSGGAVLAQTGRRTTPLGLEPFLVSNQAQRRQWRKLLLTIEERLVLAEKHPGMLADDLSDYLFARSTGHMGSLMTLINRGCQRAVRTGAERLSKELLDKVKNDAASETARRQLEKALAAGKLTTRVSGKARTAA